jgi:tricorn protease interacting factor F2/3
LADEAPPGISEYRLRLDVDFEHLRWTGTAEIDLAGEVASLHLDADGLDIRAVRRGGQAVPYRVVTETCRLTLPALAGTSGPLVIDYAGEVAQRNLLGLYRSRSGDGYVLTSQGEPTGAQKIFPCIDRPDRKARVRLEVTAPDGLLVISNTVAEGSSLVDGKRTWRFAATPPMAPYLFYLAVGRFDAVEDSSGPVTVRVLSPPGRGESGRFAAEAGRRILAALSDYYDLPYPLPKLDLVAVSEHAFGAMENWGAISFRDMRLLIDPDAGSFDRRDVFETVAHEIAHQWFGNLVTMAWWTDIWLNESFAAFLETKITQRLDPAYDPATDYVLRVAGLQAAFDGDSLATTHPVRVPVARAEEISQIFDEITYGKGAALITMLEGYLGEEAFRHGITEYLHRFRYSNARTEDLWDSLERASAAPVRRLMSPWTDRPGLPVISARLGPRGLELSQRRFGYLGSTEAEPWPIPLVYDVDDRRERILFDARSTTLPAPESAVIHLNPGALGFYRVRYDAPLYDKLLAALPGRPVRDRWIVLEDLAAFLASGDADWATYERFVRALGPTSDRLIAESVAHQLFILAMSFRSNPRVQNLARWFYADQLDRLGIDRRPDEPTAAGILRDRVGAARARVDDAFAREISGRFLGWERLDPDLRASVAYARVRTEGAAGFREVRRALEARPRPEGETLRLERALAWVDEPALLTEALDLTLSGKVNLGHVAAVIGQVATNPAGRPVVWPWLQAHLPELGSMFRGAGFLPNLLEYSIPYLGLDRPQEVRAFFLADRTPEGDSGRAKGLERLEAFERLRARLDGG